MDEVTTAILDVRGKLERGAFANEDQVSKGVVMRLLQTLGWDVFDPDRVSSEFRIGQKKVDYALRHEPFGPIALIEVKGVGKATAKGEEQLFDYCSKQGVPLAVLTDGRIWNFYLPAGMGSYEQRRFGVARVLDDEDECARILLRYLGFERVVSGQAHRDAQRDYDAYRAQIVAEQEFERVFRALVAEGAPVFVGLFCDEVERRSQVRPSEEKVRGFLRTVAARPPEEPEREERRRQSRRGNEPGRAASFTCFGKTVACRTDADVLVGVLRALAERNPSIYEQLAPHLAGRKRRVIARDRRQLYPSGSPASVVKSVEGLPDGWWLGTHSFSKQKNKHLLKAREVAGLTPRECDWQMRGAV